MRRVWPLVPLALIAVVSSLAQQKKEKPKEIRLRTVTIRVDDPKAKTKVFFKEGRIIKVLIPARFVIATQEAVLKADRGEYDREAEIVTAQGNILFYDERNRGTAAKITVNLKERKAVLEGGVRLRVKPKAKKKSGGKGSSEKSEGKKEEKWRKEALITCDRIVYWYREKRAITEGKVTVEQEDRIVTADKAEYYRDKETDEEFVVLEGNVKFEDAEGNFFTCERIVISLTEDWLEAEGLVGRLKVKEKEKKAPEEGKESGEGQKKEG